MKYFKDHCFYSFKTWKKFIYCHKESCYKSSICEKFNKESIVK